MRADKFFAEKYGSRTKAKEALESGLILLEGKALLPKDDVSGGEEFTFLSRREEYVSNGGYKLARGLDVFGESVSGCTFADLGASTGGFTDCLLQRGARRIYCVDVGESQLDDELRRSDRVTVMDKTNARYLTRESFPEPIAGAVADLSFISLRLILPAISNFLADSGRAFVLFKPQFECEGHGIGKSGILARRYHAPLLKDFYRNCIALELFPQNIVNAPIRAKKNIEYMVYLAKNSPPITEQEFLRRASEIPEEKN